jgi:superfamily II DNA or RNA helicase/HKD family nuclease
VHRQPPGLHETLITEALEASLAAVDQELVRREGLRDAEAPDRIALHVARVVERAIAALGEEERVRAGIAVARRLVEVLAQDELLPERPAMSGDVLRAVLGRRPDGRVEAVEPPLIPLLDTALLTNAPGEPRVGRQLLAEIASADRIDLVMAFIRHTGIQPLLEGLRRHCATGRELRVLTTTYTGSTQAEALDELRDAGALVKVSYDTGSTRLHAKAWLFHRRSGFSTAYVGSSNLTHQAQVTGLEWNLRISGARNPPVVEKIAAVFESYWNHGDFVSYDPAEFRQRRAEARPTGSEILLPPTEVRLEPFQERLLEQIALARQLGRHRNLLVSATGTGKTVMAAVDYARLRAVLPRARLLFVAHREEILTQSLATFRHVLREQAFGETWVRGQRPARFEHVFASIQSLNASGFEHLAPDHYDVVVVDEFHHAAAESYRALLDHVQPVELVGLTATPERSDGLPVLDWFDGRIAAELRLWDAVDQHRLVPFSYFGISDGTDLRQVPWRRGRGYDVDGLTRLLTADDVWAKLVLDQVRQRADDPQTMRALGFCISVEHARFMARVFRERGVAATAIWSDTPDEERRRALTDLAAGRVRVVFSVDLFNEGVDVPAVDTLLMLRPTDSPTLFLQQLGRGLRRSHGKTVCTVLDFVGHHRKEFRFDRRFRALLGGTRRDVESAVAEGFPFLPAGCHMELDAVARERVLESIHDAVPGRWTAKVEELRALARSRPDCTLADWLAATGCEIEDLYHGGKSWSELRCTAGLPIAPAGPHEKMLRRACGRLLHLDDLARIDTYRGWLTSPTPPDPARLGVAERRLLRMLVAQLVDKAVEKGTSLTAGCDLVWRHPQVRAELGELLAVLAERVEHLPAAWRGHPDVPLRVHARYTRLEILAALGVGDGAKVAPWQTGVYQAREARSDLLAFTLDKTSGGFSPTTRYRDHAISPTLIHWESQSVVRADSETGRRYQEHARRGWSILLFARLRTSERAFYFLGPGTYVKHESELPMAVTWELEHPLPGDLFGLFAAAVA